MKKKLQVFVSSTFQDLIVERQVAVAALLEAGHIPAGMELFAAGSVSQLEAIKKWIDDSDVFMLLLGGRYGSREAVSQKSYIQLEYEYAIEKAKPMFAIVATDKYLVRKADGDNSKLTDLQLESYIAFKKTVLSKICDHFDTLDQIKVTVFKALRQIEEDGGCIGWVRANSVVDSTEAYNDFVRVQRENEELRRRLMAFGVGVGETEGPEYRAKQIAATLTSEAKQLLLQAELPESEGRIFYLKFQEIVGTPGKAFCRRESGQREIAQWREALEELIKFQLVDVELSAKAINTKLKSFGYMVIDQLMAK